MRTILAALLRFYQIFISPLKGRTCRFHPSCSEYSRQAILTFGIPRGICMSLRRIARCHPFHPGGYDPVERR